jgi:hypothetical protein
MPLTKTRSSVNRFDLWVANILRFKQLLFSLTSTECFVQLKQVVIWQHCKIFVEAVALGGTVFTKDKHLTYTCITSSHTVKSFFTSNIKIVTMAVETEQHWDGSCCLINIYVYIFLDFFSIKLIFARKIAFSYLILGTKLLIRKCGLSCPSSEDVLPTLRNETATPTTFGIVTRNM